MYLHSKFDEQAQNYQLTRIIGSKAMNCPEES